MLLSATVFGDGHPIVLLPWFGHDGSAMVRAFEPVFVLETPWQRIYLDLPGTGGSPSVEPSSDAVLDAVGETVHSILGDDPYLLAGCSYGGYLAAGLARRAPEQVVGLLLVCTGTKIQPETRDLSGLQESISEPHWLDGVPAELHDYFSRAIGCQTRSVADRIAAVFNVSGDTDEDYLETLRSTGYALSGEIAGRSFDAPTTILAGRSDRIGGYRDQFDSLADYPRASYVVLDRAGHYLPFEQPERFTVLANDWLRQVGASG